MTSPSAETETALKRFFAETPPAGVVSAYLFGSHAAGRQHRESDVDVAVVVDRRVLPSARDRFELRVGLGSELIHVVARNEVDVVVLNDSPPLLARRVLGEGIEVFCGDRRQDRDFRRDVQLRAADLEPFLARYRQLKLDALASLQK